MENVESRGPVLGVIVTNSIISMADKNDSRFKKISSCLIHSLSWIPVLGTVAGIVRIIFGSMAIHNAPSKAENKSFWKARGVTSILRGSLEVLTLGLIAPVNIIVDLTIMVPVVTIACIFGILLKIKS